MKLNYSHIDEPILECKYYQSERWEATVDQGIIQFLYTHADFSGTIMKFTVDGPYNTAKRVFDYGIYNCSTCNYMNPLENQHCRNCNDPKFIIVSND